MKKRRKILSLLLCGAMLFILYGQPAFTTGSARDSDVACGISGLCEHHPVHMVEGGYQEGSRCIHSHNETCGYVEAVEEEACNMECTDTNEDGVIDHAESCAYVPAVENRSCSHVHDEACGNVIDTRTDNQDLPDFAFPVDQELDVSNSNNLTHTLNVVAAGGSLPPFEGTSWNLTGGAYTVSGTAKDYETLKISGKVSLMLSNAAINHIATDVNQYAPAIIIESGSNVTLTLSGKSVVQGSPGYAGIYVAEGATLTISGNGSLVAQGGDGYKNTIMLPTTMQSDNNVKGYFSGGAGIGGNGVWVYSSKIWVNGSVPSFGTVQIEDGTIVAQGGDMIEANVGGGAGIGSGGGSGQKNNSYAISGTVAIKGGVINAVGGGSQHNSLTGGGAGIGSGGATGELLGPHNNAVQVSISGGEVIATGTADGAGIGGGTNVDGGIIVISGGTVTATGGYEIEKGIQDGAYGGAGIGGGDNGGVTSISISGGTVAARAIGAAAGIGSGSSGFVGTVDYTNDKTLSGSISISGFSNVTAYGGSHADGLKYGGAGIGAGRSVYDNNGCGSISITGSAKVYAYAGAKAQAIGVGSLYEGTDTNHLTLADTVTLWAQNRGDSDFPALLHITTAAGGPISYTSADTYLVSSGEIADEASGYLNLPGDDGKTFSYALDGQKLTINGNHVSAAAPQGTVGKWATLFHTIPNITISYQYIGTVPDGATLPAPDTVKLRTYIAKQPDAVLDYKFDGWYIDKGCTSIFVDGTVLERNTVLYGKWVLKTTPVNPTVVTYKVEHYKENLDDTYTLVATDFPLYGKIGTTVKAVAKTYEHFYINSERSVLSGEVVMPIEENDEVKLLTLKVYYDLDEVTVFYDLNGGTGADGVEYTPETVKYGNFVTVKAAPSREGYIFLGWSDGTDSYIPDDSISLVKNITLTAQWKEKSKPTDSAKSVKPAEPKNSNADSSQTGDNSNLSLWIVLLSLAGVGITGIVVYSRKKK